MNPETRFTQTANRPRQQRIIPGINFTCDGFIVKWILRGRWDSSDGHDFNPDFQIWRRGDENGAYIPVGNTTIRVVSENSSRIYEYPVSPPLAFQRGDVLGIFQPRNVYNRLRVYFETNNGPTNYYIRTGSNEMEPPLQEFSTAVADNEPALPLVTVEISESSNVSVLIVYWM